MYPQYSATTTASACDALFAALRVERRVPALRIVRPYFEHPAYLGAMETVIRESLSGLAREAEHFVLSFHGLPKAYAERGDPYPSPCQQTAHALANPLCSPADPWALTH